MAIFKKKKRKVYMDIDWRIDPEEYLHLSRFSAILLYFVAWSSLIAASILYLLAIGAFLIVVMHFRDSLFDYGFLGMKLALPFFLGLFFMLFSLSPSFQGYVLGAYLSSLSINVLGYELLKRNFPGRLRRW